MLLIHHLSHSDRTGVHPTDDLTWHGHIETDHVYADLLCTLDQYGIGLDIVRDDGTVGRATNRLILVPVVCISFVQFIFQLLLELVDLVNGDEFVEVITLYTQSLFVVFVN